MKNYQEQQADAMHDLRKAIARARYARAITKEQFDAIMAALDADAQNDEHGYAAFANAVYRAIGG